MSVLNGQLANQTTFNNGYMSRTDPTTSTVAVVQLNNALPISGPSISNVQQAINELFQACGLTGVGDTGANNYATEYVITDGDSYKEAIEKLDLVFKGVGGHSHSGLDGDGAKILADNLDNFNFYFGQYAQVSVPSVSAGLSFDVSAYFLAKTAGGGNAQVGVITDAPLNRVDFIGTDGNFFEDSEGQRVYGRLTWAAGVWTLSFYTLEAGVETAHNFAGGNISLIFREVYDQASRPTIPASPLEFNTLDITADILDATQALAGKVKLQNATSAAIAASGTQGTANGRVANADHTHAGVHSLGIDGDPTQALGDVLLEQGSNITLSWSSGKIKIDSTGGGIGYQEPLAGTVNGINNTFGPLSYSQSNNDSILVFINYFAVPRSGYTVSGSNVVFTAGWTPQPGQTVYAFYLTSGVPSLPPVSSGIYKCEHRTITVGEAAAKQLTLALTPSYPTEVAVDFVGGTAQVPGIDFSVLGNVLGWSSLGLDGLVASGDILRIIYIS